MVRPKWYANPLWANAYNIKFTTATLGCSSDCWLLYIAHSYIATEMELIWISFLVHGIAIACLY